MMETKNKIRLGITIGDVNGIGLEVILKTFLDDRMMNFCTPIIYGSSKITSYHRKALNLDDFNLNLIKYPDKAHPKKTNVINCWEEEVKIQLGEVSDIAGKYAVKSLNAAVKDLKDHRIDAIVTAPINKKNTQSEGFKFEGHTEYFADQFGSNQYLMFMVNESIKVGIVKGHVPLDQVASTLNTEEIVAKIWIMNQSLKKDFGIQRPKIGVLGLNPHAGERGLIGEEESKVIKPAIEQANKEDILLMGPFSADGYFGNGTFKQFDATLAMYHDQGMIPFKLLSFGAGVNFTAGLPIVRTSPDHGTAYELAGKNKASASSFRQAVYTACDIYKNRIEYESLTANAIKPALAES